MIKLIKRVLNLIFSYKASMPDLFPRTDYQKYVPQNAKELSVKNWRSTGDSLNSAMEKVKDENKS